MNAAMATALNMEDATTLLSLIWTFPSSSRGDFAKCVHIERHVAMTTALKMIDATKIVIAPSSYRGKFCKKCVHTERDVVMKTALEMEDATNFFLLIWSCPTELPW